MPDCPRCGNALLTDAPAGMCPHCLLREGTALAAAAAVRPGSFLPPEADEIALIFPEYEIEALIGRGGMGMVYRAREIESGRAVAIKILPPEIAGEPEFLERFYTEAAALDELSHPNIVDLLGFGDREGFAYFVMEHVDGMDLARRLRQDPPFTVPEIEKIVTDLCEALGYAHSMGVVHRDIKPANLLITPEGSVKLADFGIAKIAIPGSREMNLTLTRAVMGTTHYMAPEVSTGSGKADHRSDVYATGVILYEMLTGQIPAGRFELPSERIPALNRQIDEVVARALATEPDRRFQSARAVSESFSKSLAYRPGRWKIAIVPAVIAVLGGFLLAWKPWVRKPDPMPDSGTVIVEELGRRNTPADVRLSLSAESSQGVTPDSINSNRGDYWIHLPAEDATNTGTLITTIAETSRQSILGWGWPFATSSFTTAGTVARYSIAVHRLANSQEYNMNAAFGWFSYEQFIAGETFRLGDARRLVDVRGSKGITFGKQVIPLDATGATRIDLRRLKATSKNGILLASVAENIDSFAMVESRDDGTFTVLTVENEAPPGLLSRGGFSFVHIPVSDAGKGRVSALGRVRSDATTEVSGGTFTLAKGRTGQWLLHFEQPGTLLLTPQSSASGNNANNIVSYRRDPTTGGYVVESRDLRTAALEDGATAAEPMFNFVFLTP